MKRPPRQGGDGGHAAGCVRNAQGGEQLSEAQQIETDVAAAPAEAVARPRMFSGLRGRLLLLTAAFVLFAEFLIYPVLAGSYRNSWLATRAQAAQIAALAVEAAPDGRVSEELSRQLLAQAQVVSVAVQEQDFRGEILPPSIKIEGDLVSIDLRTEGMIDGIIGAFAHMFAPDGRFLRVILVPSMTQDAVMEVIVPEAALKSSLAGFSRTLLVVSLIVSAVVGALVYFAIYRLVVRPMRRLTDSIVAFSEAPEGAEVEPMPGESDEMQRANSALQSMQRTVSAALRQRKRLAELGEAVAKINHDLRNSLSAAHIVSEGLSESDDPRVKRAAPRLERAIERAVNLAEATLRYGRAEPQLPSLSSVGLAPVVEEAALEGMAGCSEIDWVVDAPNGVVAKADPDHVHRIVANLVRNSVRAIRGNAGRGPRGRITATIRKQGDTAIVEIADNGPGVPDAVVKRLFQPFTGSSSRGGAGLGLAVARELARGMKGDLELTRNGSGGATFTLRMPACA
ncbi:MAG: HAMP domain-containing sensor histidine kinase [Hyphomonadaceae bacterium]